MNHLFLSLLFGLSTHTVVAQVNQPSSFTDSAKYPVYRGNDLGLTFPSAKQAGTLRVWAPTAQAVYVRLYRAGIGGVATAKHSMHRGQQGTWTLSLPAGTTGYYTVQGVIDGQNHAEVADPYARAVGPNGRGLG